MMADCKRALLLVAILSASRAGWARPPNLHNPLLVPDPGQNHSAFRLDSEVFGWNREFTEVGAVCMEMARDPEGAHRGETFLLVYPVTSTVPKHNVICHFITHVGLPDNPVPLEVAGDYMWTIENSFLDMWPRRPKRRRPKNGIDVTPLWAAVPTTPKDDANKDPSHAAPARNTCTPWVGFVMRRGPVTRLQRFLPVDLSARCDLLSLTDSRTYWGTPEIAASMVRFDFNAGPANEESARFVVSALWREGHALQFEVQNARLLPPKARTRFRAELDALGDVTFDALAPASRRQASGPTVQFTTAAAWQPLARHLARTLGVAASSYAVDERLGNRLILTVRPTGLRPGTTPNAAPVPQPLVAPKTQNGPPPARSHYLQDFKVTP